MNSCKDVSGLGNRKACEGTTIDSRNTQSNRGDGAEQYIRLLMENERRIYAFILYLVPNWTDADDVMQETAAIMWRKFDTYVPNSNFAAWGIKIAHYCVLNYRRSRSNSPLVFSSELVEVLSQEAGNIPQDTDRRMDALRRCVTKLTDPDRDLVRIHYEEGVQVKRIAQRQHMSIHQVYRTLVRVHAQLLRCVRRTLAAEGTL